MSNEDGDGAHSSELKAPSWLAPGGALHQQTGAAARESEGQSGRRV
jgi:hypothetical protein